MATRRAPVSYFATENDRAELEQLARLRSGGNLTGALRWAVELAALVAGDVATFGAIDPAEALDAYVKARCAEA